MSHTINIGLKLELPYAIEESINRLRVNIGFLGNDVKKIMIVSSNPNEGKSFVTMQLWRQMAEAGTKTLLIDGDLRKSVMADKYFMERADGGVIKGLSNYLSSHKTPEEAIYHTEYEAGDILPNTENVVNPSLLIESKKFKELMDYASEEYRYTFIDCPPLGLVSDGEQIAAMCDGAILCVRAEETSKAVIRESMQRLQRAGCPVVGMILTRVNASNNGYYNKYYGGKYYTSEYYQKND